MASLAVSVLCLALIARQPEHHHENQNLHEKIVYRDSKNAEPSLPPPPKNGDMYGARLFPGAHTHVYQDNQNVNNTGLVAATVHGNLIVLGKVIEVDGIPNEVPIDLPPPPPPPSWGTETHRDTYSSSDHRGKCALGLLKEGLKTYTKCEGCALQKFESERKTCCAHPAKCMRPNTTLGCSRKFDEVTCSNTGCEWKAEPVLVSSAYEQYYTQCVVAANNVGDWVSYTELDANSVNLVYRKRQHMLYETMGASARSEMDKPSYFLSTQLELPPFEYHIFSSAGLPLGIENSQSSNPYKKNLSDSSATPATFLFQAINDPVPITDPEPSLKVMLEYTKSLDGYPMHLLQTEEAVEYHQNAQNRPIVLTSPAKGVVSGTASWTSGGKSWRIAPSSVKKMVNENAPDSPEICEERVQHAVECFETRTHALCIAELASSTYKRCCKLLYENNIYVEC